MAAAAAGAPRPAAPPRASPRHRAAGTPAERRTADAGSGGAHAGGVLREDVAQVAARRLHRRHRLRRPRGRAGRRLERRPGGGGSRRRGRGQLPARPDDLRRPLRQQRLAAGAAEAGHQAHVGQRRADGAGARPSGSASTKRRHRRGAARGPQLRVPALDQSRATPPDAITIPLGYGRTRAGRVGNGAGFNGYVLRGSAAPWFGAAEVAHDRRRLRRWSARRTTGRSKAATSSRSAPLEEFKSNPTFAQEMEHIEARRPHLALPDARVHGLRSGAWRST